MSSVVHTEGIGPAFPKRVTPFLDPDGPVWSHAVGQLSQPLPRLGFKLVFPDGLYLEVLASVGIALFSFKVQ